MLAVDVMDPAQGHVFDPGSADAGQTIDVGFCIIDVDGKTDEAAVDRHGCGAGIARGPGDIGQIVGFRCQFNHYRDIYRFEYALGEFGGDIGVLGDPDTFGLAFEIRRMRALVVEFDQRNAAIFQHLCQHDPAIDGSRCDITDDMRPVFMRVLLAFRQNRNPLLVRFADVTRTTVEEKIPVYLALNGLPAIVQNGIFGMLCQRLHAGDIANGFDDDSAGAMVDTFLHVVDTIAWLRGSHDDRVFEVETAKFGIQISHSYAPVRLSFARERRLNFAWFRASI